MILYPGSKAYDLSTDGLPPVVRENMIIEGIPSELGASWVAKSSPGFQSRFNVVGAGRGMFSAYTLFDSAIFALAGDTFYRVRLNSGVWEQTSLPGVVSGTDKAIFTSIRGYIAFVADKKGWVYDGANIIQITDSDLPAVTSVAAMDGRLIFTVDGSDELWWSGIFDPTNINGLAFASAETFEDDLTRVLVDHREIWLFGAKVTEIWRSTGDSSQPFARIGDMIIEKGCRSPHSPTKADNTVYWVGQDKIIYRAPGSSLERVSTHSVEENLKKLSDADFIALEGITYTEDGHVYYALTSRGNWTLVYDISTGEWEKRSSPGLNHWGPIDVVEAYGSNYAVSGTVLGEISRSVGGENNQDVTRKISVNIPAAEPTAIERMGLTVRILSGSAEVQEDLSFRFSDDGGITYTAPEVITVHNNEDKAQRINLFGQGQTETPGRVYEINYTGQSQLVIGPVFLNEPLH